MYLSEIAQVIRSKNAGPLQITLDIMFSDRGSYDRAVVAPGLHSDALAERYHLDRSAVTVVPFEAALAIKVVLDRPIIAGTPGDSDVYGAQQHVPLLEIEV